MDDELEDKVLYQTYASHMKLVSKFAVGIPTGLTAGVNAPLGYFWRVVRSYALKPEILVCGGLLVVMLFYLQAVDVWSRTLLTRILQYTFGRTGSKFLADNAANAGDKISWELKRGYAAAYAVQGHRARMEDRFVLDDDIGRTGVSLFAVFDGHGGEFAANYARDILVPNINKRVARLKDIVGGKIASGAVSSSSSEEEKEKENAEPITNKETKTVEAPTMLDRKKSFRKTVSASSDDSAKKQGRGGGAGLVTDPELLNKLNSLPRPITREVRPAILEEKVRSRKFDANSYIEGEKINYGRLLTDEVLAADGMLVEAAKKNMDVAGTTALIAMLEEDKLIVANVGDSRGVMCDNKGNAIPLSFDHKPQQQRERQRINKAGGLVTFNGVWRVAGILATSRALGDYPLKDKKLVIAEPDILTFDLSYHDPMFLILASDGLWDTFTNEEAVAFIKERINEPYFGAKSITLQSYYRGSLDNITVVVINLKDRKYGLSRMEMSA